MTIRSRMWWLFINLGTAMLASSVVAALNRRSKLVTLAVIMPIISGMGGNAATQTMAVTACAGHQPADQQQHMAHDHARMVDRQRQWSGAGRADGDWLPADLS
jgi:hypothetical protein